MIALTIGGEVRHLPDSETNEAMRMFWEARSAGDPSATIAITGSHGGDDGAEDDNGTGGAPPPVPAPRALLPATTSSTPTLPSSTVPKSVPAGVVSILAKDRIERQEGWLKEAGFAAPPPIFAPGARVNALGEANFRLARRRVQEMPLFPQAAAMVCTEVAGEGREDHAVRLRDLRMEDDGRLHVSGARYTLEPTAFLQLATLGGFGVGARYLRDLCGAQLRAQNVNAQLGKAKGRTVTLRTRRGGSGMTGAGGERQVFATVTPSYAPCDTDAVLRAVAGALTDAHTEMVYDGSGIAATALFMPETVVDLAAGDVFKAGVRIECDDTGHGRIRITGVVFRNLCLNLIIIGEGEVEHVSLVHRGDARRILDVVSEGVARARQSIGKFLEAWGHARTVRVNPMDVFKDWVDRKEVHVRGERDQRVVLEHLLTAWSHEPGETLADCVNAVSRAAHETTVWADDIQRELERQASRLVYVGARRSA